jgi:hypothetical protein
VSFSDEATYIAERAVRRVSVVVTLGPLLFFSTDTGDAWVLDPADSLARCLAKDGKVLPHGIIETAERFSVEWTADYRIDGEVMVFAERSGRVRAMMGYPVAVVNRALERMRPNR